MIKMALKARLSQESGWLRMVFHTMVSHKIHEIYRRLDINNISTLPLLYVQYIYIYDIYIYKIVPMIHLLSTFSVVHEILVEDVLLQCVYHTTGSTTWRNVNLRPKGTHLFGGYIVPPFISRNNQDI